VSDIDITFDWYFWPMIAAFIGWPGLLLGTAAGAGLWRRHRVLGAILGMIAGTLLWDAGYYFLR
jgi:Na+/proline symporter